MSHINSIPEFCISAVTPINPLSEAQYSLISLIIADYIIRYREQAESPTYKEAVKLQKAVLKLARK